jgi:hypothetical protein
MERFTGYPEQIWHFLIERIKMISPSISPVSPQNSHDWFQYMSELCPSIRQKLDPRSIFDIALNGREQLISDLE